jgi:hypothetical protein
MKRVADSRTVRLIIMFSPGLGAERIVWLIAFRPYMKGSSAKSDSQNAVTRSL